MIVITHGVDYVAVISLVTRDCTVCKSVSSLKATVTRQHVYTK